MAQNPMHAASIPNPRLKPFDVLIGTWNTTGAHPMLPNVVLHGRTSFEWLENGAFLMMRSEMDETAVPSGIAVIGSDDAEDKYFMLYFDERGVSRKYQVTLEGNLWKWWRNAPGFSQRFTGTIGEGGNIIIGKGELTRDGSTWEGDLELTYRRVK